MTSPTRRPGPGPWRFGQRKTASLGLAKSPGTPTNLTVIRPPLIAEYRFKYPGADNFIFPNVVAQAGSFIPGFSYDYPSVPKKVWPGDTWVYQNVALLPTDAPVNQKLLETQWRALQWPSGFEPPNIASLSVTPPAAAQAAGRHHKRYKVILGSRTVYFATKAEAVAARERHRDVAILKAVATGVDPRKIKVRRARITQVSVDGRYPPDLAPAKQIARSHASLEALNEARMREEEEIAIALLLS